MSSLICYIYWVVLALNHYFTGIVSEKKKDEDDEDGGYPESRRNTVRSSVDPNSDSDWNGKSNWRVQLWLWVAFGMLISVISVS